MDPKTCLKDLAKEKSLSVPCRESPSFRPVNSQMYRMRYTKSYPANLRLMAVTAMFVGLGVFSVPVVGGKEVPRLVKKLG
jgi:hypothetical protein